MNNFEKFGCINENIIHGLPYYKTALKEREDDTKVQLPKLLTFSTQQFLNAWKYIKKFDPEEFVVIGVYDIKNDPTAEILTYEGDDNNFYSFVCNFSDAEFYKNCRNLNRFIFSNKSKKFIVVSKDGFRNAQSVARFISDFYMNDEDRKEFIKKNIDNFLDNFEFSFWLRRAYFGYDMSEDEMKLILSMNKAEVLFNNPSILIKN